MRKYYGHQYDYEEKDQEKAVAEQEMRAAIDGKGILYPYKYLLSNKKFLIWIVIALYKRGLSF